MPAGYRALLSLPAVAALLAATAFSRLAMRMFLLAIVLLALDRFHSPALAGWLPFAALAPGLIASPLSGAVLDRIGGLTAIRIDLAVSAALVGILALVTLTGVDNRLLLIGLVAVFSLTSPLSAAGVRALLPRLVPAEALDRANALDTLIFGAADVVGPAAAGVLTALAGAPVTLLAIAALHAAAAFCLRGLRSPEQHPAVRSGLLQAAGAGLLTVARTPTLRGLVVSYALYDAAWGMLLVAVPVLLARHVGSGEARDSLAGMLWAGSGAAGVLGALVAGHLRVTGRERWFIGFGMLLTGAAIWPVAAGGGAAWLAAGLVLVGCLAGPVDVGVLTLRQRRTPPERLGRVLAVSMALNQTGTPVGSVFAGWLLGWAPDAVLMAAALSAGLGSFACWRLIPAAD